MQQQANKMFDDMMLAGLLRDLAQPKQQTIQQAVGRIDRRAHQKVKQILLLEDKKDWHICVD